MLFQLKANVTQLLVLISCRVLSCITQMLAMCKMHNNASLFNNKSHARLAQSVERETLNLKVAGSTPAFGFPFCSATFFPHHCLDYQHRPPLSTHAALFQRYGSCSKQVQTRSRNRKSWLQQTKYSVDGTLSPDQSKRYFTRRRSD